MRKELEEKLYQKYPDLLSRKDRESDPYNHGSLMAFGFDHGDGWYTIMDALFSALTALYHNHGVRVVPQQIKTKFGSLRFYYGAEDDPEVIKQRLRPLHALAYWLWKPVARLWPRWLFSRRSSLRDKPIWYLATLRRRMYRYVMVKRYSWSEECWEPAKPKPVNQAELAGRLAGYVGMAENMSARTCERCGAPGEEVSDGYWVAILCAKCKEPEVKQDVGV